MGKKKNSGCDNSVGSSSNEIKHTEKEDNSTHCSLRDCEDKILHVEGNEESDSMKAVDGECSKKDNDENTNRKKKKKRKTKEKKVKDCDNSVGSNSDEKKCTETVDNTHFSLND